jgi:hypothetical protein
MRSDNKILNQKMRKCLTIISENLHENRLMSKVCSWGEATYACSIHS